MGFLRILPGFRTLAAVVINKSITVHRGYVKLTLSLSAPPKKNNKNIEYVGCQLSCSPYEENISSILIHVACNSDYYPVMFLVET